MKTGEGISRIPIYSFRVFVYSARVVRSWSDKATEDVFHGVDSKAARSLPRTTWGALVRKLDRLDSASALRDLANPGARLERLKGDQKGRYGIRVNDRYRVTFRWGNGDAHEVRCEDYH